MARRFILSQRATFAAVHHLGGSGGQAHYAQVHGHTFEAEAGVAGAPDDDAGWIADLARLKTALEAAVGGLRDQVLNDVPDLPRPTLEHVCAYVAARLAADFPTLAYVEVARPSLGQRCRLDLAADPGADAR